MNTEIKEAVHILMEGTDDSYSRIQTILEDATSPVTRTYKERLFQSIMDRSHIDFGDIPKSKGDITKYSGYNAMYETLNVLLKIAREEKSNDLESAVTTVLTAVQNIRQLKPVYVKGFANKCDIAILDYNTYVLTTVEGTTSLMCDYIDFMKTPSSPTYKLSLKDTKYRANSLYISQLEKFNNVNKDNKYSKYMNTMVNKGTENLFGIDDAIIAGYAAISVIALSIIPVTRELIYLFNESRRKVSELFSLQAYFLELNKATVEANTELTPEKKKKILEKQEKLRKKYLFLAEKLRISSIKANETSHKKLDEDNKGMSVDGIEDDISDSDIVIM